MQRESNVFFQADVIVSKEMVKLILKNPKTEINKTDNFGVNAFWIAAFYSHISVIYCVSALKVLF